MAIAYFMVWAPRGFFPFPNGGDATVLYCFSFLYLFVAVGSGALFAVPQYLAQLVILVAVHGAARRLGFDVRASACSAFPSAINNRSIGLSRSPVNRNESRP